MPTPVNAARQCLTQEAATVLDEAVVVARRRGHNQTTSLHMVSSLLSLPNSALREACMRTRNNAYSTKAQFKALELSLSVSLDRLPSSQAIKVDEPPVSNSLMAAVKRSQSNQRRQPENFNFYQQYSSSSCSSIPVVKVELRNLVLSILDDPLVSRVFGEAGFRSCDIKLATLRPGNSFHAHQMFGYMSRCKRPSPPLFLCNLSNSESKNGNEVMGGKGFSFPFMGCFYGDENSRRIGEVMVRDKKMNPLLLGVSAIEALRSFMEIVGRKVNGVLPEELSGLSVVCVKDEVSRFVNGDCDEGAFKSRFEEVEKTLESGVGDGVVVNFGGFEALGGDEVRFDVLRYLVSEFGRLREIYGRKLWMIGAVATYEIYLKIMNKFPSIEEDLDLEILPITSIRSSLMDSFVPLGGFFSMPPETKSTLNNTSQYVTRCHLCNEKYEQEVAALSKGGLSASISQKYQSSLPSWLQIAKSSTQTDSPYIKCKDDRLLLNAKIMCLHKKWDAICQQHHQFPHVLVSEDMKENQSHDSNNHSNESSTQRGLSSVLDMALKAHNLRPLSNSMVKDPKLLYKALVERVDQQEEAISAITQALTQTGLHGVNRSDIWMNFHGPDRFGKRRIGVALAEILYGSVESFIYADLTFQDETARMDTMFKSRVMNKCELTMRGTVADYLVEKLSKKPCVVFLENIDKADPVVQNSLTRAVKIGKFTDLNGREVNIGNCIFIGTSTRWIGDSQSHEESSTYLEEDILRVKGGLIQILITFDLNDDHVQIVNKRKLIGYSRKRDESGRLEIAKRAHKATNAYLDLNLPAEGGEIYNEEYDSGSNPENLWLKDFEPQIDRVIVFNRFDFDTLEEKLFEEINECLHKVVGHECSLEMEPIVTRQLIAATYLFGCKKVEDWIECVLRRGFVEAVGKFSINARSVVKLVTCEGVFEEEGESLLPAKIIMN